jgi:hypothetical protein
VNASNAPGKGRSNGPASQAMAHSRDGEPAKRPPLGHCHVIGRLVERVRAQSRNQPGPDWSTGRAHRLRQGLSSLVGAGKVVGVTAFAVFVRGRLLFTMLVTRPLRIVPIRSPIEVRVIHHLLLGHYLCFCGTVSCHSETCGRRARGFSHPRAPFHGSQTSD